MDTEIITELLENIIKHPRPWNLSLNETEIWQDVIIIDSKYIVVKFDHLNAVAKNGKDRVWTRNNFKAKLTTAQSLKWFEACKAVKRDSKDVATEIIKEYMIKDDCQ